MEAIKLQAVEPKKRHPLTPKHFAKKQLHESKMNRRKIALPTMEGLCFEKIKHILYLEANGNYTTLHFTDGRQTLVCRTLRDIENMLPKEAFARLHRSHTVNLRHIKKYVRGKGGYVVLYNGATLSVSAGQREEFLTLVEKFFC